VFQLTYIALAIFGACVLGASAWLVMDVLKFNPDGLVVSSIGSLLITSVGIDSFITGRKTTHLIIRWMYVCGSWLERTVGGLEISIHLKRSIPWKTSKYGVDATGWYMYMMLTKGILSQWTKRALDLITFSTDHGNVFQRNLHRGVESQRFFRLWMPNLPDLLKI
jgi:hypothetical protein